MTPAESRVIALLQRGDVDDAEALAQRLVKTSPGRLVAHDLLLQALRTQGRIEKIDALVRRYETKEEKRRLSAERVAYARAMTVKLSNSETSAADEQWCAELLRRAQAALDPRDVGSWIAVADAWSVGKLLRYGTARRVMERAVALNPTSVPARYFLLVQYDHGILGGTQPVSPEDRPRPDMVVRQAEEIVRLRPQFRQAYYFGGLAKLQMGDRSGAVAWLRKYRELNPYKKGFYYENSEKVIRSITGL